MIKKKLFIWVCDYSETSGEGKLARLFLKNFKNTKNYEIELNQSKILRNRYTSTIQGIFYCWKKYLNNQKVCYLNYLPFWNFLIFSLLPPKTILGPITGGSRFKKSNILNFFIRGVIFPIFYKISEFSLIFRSNEIIFSTDLLKKYLFLQTIKKSKFNYIFKSYSSNKRRKKKIDFLIYYRKHKNKKSFFPYNFIKKLIENKYKVQIIGDKLNIPSLKNHGRISNKKVLKLQSIANYTVPSGENFYSFFIIECLSNNVKVVIDKNQTYNFKFLKNKIITLNYNKTGDFKKLKKL